MRKIIIILGLLLMSVFVIGAGLEMFEVPINDSWMTRQIDKDTYEIWHKEYVINKVELESEKTKLESDVLTAKITMDTCPNDKYYMECVDNAWNEQVIKEIEIEQINEKIELVK